MVFPHVQIVCLSTPYITICHCSTYRSWRRASRVPNPRLCISESTLAALDATTDGARLVFKAGPAAGTMLPRGKRGAPGASGGNVLVIAEEVSS